MNKLDESILWSFFAGSVGGIFSDLVVHPIDTARVNLQNQRGHNQLKYRNTMHAIYKISAEEGIRGLYKGFGAGKKKKKKI